MLLIRMHVEVHMVPKVIAAVFALSFLLLSQSGSNAAGPKRFVPTYNDKGELLTTADYRQWIF